MRVKQPVGKRGSLKWMQTLVQSHQKLLDDAIRAAGGVGSDETLDWKSPRSDDDYAEYRDGSFLAKVGQPHLKTELQAFWPSRGPQWDGLAVGSKGTVVLVEAKAHIAELTSTCQASAASKVKITAALNATKAAMGISADSDWTVGFYQYANRLAHLHFLRSQGVKATLVFLYFSGDTDMNGPASPEDWRSSLSSTYRHLGISDQHAIPGLVSIFIDTQALYA